MRSREPDSIARARPPSGLPSHGRSRDARAGHRGTIVPSPGTPMGAEVLTMHAMTGLFTMDPTHKTQLIEGLPNLIAGVREMPGYVVGFWTWDHATNVSTVLVVFEREEQ